MEKYIKAPLEKEIVKTLRAGDYVYITGTIYTARDAAHKRMDETLREGKELPVPLKDEIVYYMGPSPAREGRVIGSAGPTTASRMDKYTPKLLGLRTWRMIGKETVQRSHRCNHSQSISLFCGSRRCRGSSFKMYSGVRGGSLRRSRNRGNTSADCKKFSRYRCN